MAVTLPESVTVGSARELLGKTEGSTQSDWQPLLTRQLWVVSTCTTGYSTCAKLVLNSSILPAEADLLCLVVAAKPIQYTSKLIFMQVKLKLGLTYPSKLQHDFSSMGKHDTLPCCHPHSPSGPGRNVGDAAAGMMEWSCCRVCPLVYP